MHFTKLLLTKFAKLNIFLLSCLKQLAFFGSFKLNHLCYLITIRMSKHILSNSRKVGPKIVSV